MHRFLAVGGVGVPGHFHFSSRQGTNMLRIRRCLGWAVLVAVTAVFGLGVAHGQTGGDPPKDKKEAKEEKKGEAAAKDAGKTYAFEFRSAPWGQVLDWLKDVTGQPIVSNLRPTGSLIFIPPNGPDGKPRKYTVPEIIDVLNESLLEQKFMIIRRQASITIWPADEKVPPELVRPVYVEDITSGDLAKTEFVKVIYPLQSLVAENFAPGCKKMMGPFSEVIPLEEPNHLVLIDNVANLRSVIKVIQDIDKES